MFWINVIVRDRLSAVYNVWMQRILGIDYGRARLGVAISDPTGSIALPLEILHVPHPRAAVPDLKRLTAAHAVTRIVVGLPLDASGAENDLTSEIRAWSETIIRATGCPVEFVDERFTSQLADRVIDLHKPGQKRRKAREHRDQIAAQAILQSWLDQQRNG
ncbi:MAG: Holliday junction resolvase RuvX [Candidatus Dadabacteria bacterium]|nr:MAG: Holliday junction resolvase RuvX [Candidatus Dadabacteria bacterium]